MTQNINIPKHVSHETIDGETIIINLDKGHYFSLQHTASLLWQYLAKCKNLSSLLDSIKKKGEAAYKEVETFFLTLQEEGLIEIVENSATNTQTVDIPIENYQTPTLEKYTDMEDLLLLDPIHDTDDSGWPHKIT